MKRLWMVFAAGLLAGCLGRARHLAQPEVYDFGLPVGGLAEDGRWSSVGLEIRAPQWVDSRAIEYRLLYENPLQLRSYASSHWAGAPGPLLAQRLRQQLGFVGSSGQPGCLLLIDIEEFSQLFDTPARSRGLLQGRASLFDLRRQIIADRRLIIEQPAPTANARGGVTALVAASDDLARQLGVWLNDQEKRGRLKRCRSTVGESQ